MLLTKDEMLNMLTKQTHGLWWAIRLLDKNMEQEALTAMSQVIDDLIITHDALKASFDLNTEEAPNVYLGK